MGGNLGGAAGGAGLCRARVRWATGCVGIAGCGIRTLGACGLSMLEGFLPLEVGSHPTYPFRYVGGPSAL